MRKFGSRRALLLGAGAAVLGAGTFGALRYARAQQYEDAARRTWQLPPPDAGVRGLVHAATLAANSHNTQPWRLSVTPGAIPLRPDLTRRCPAVDPDDHHVFVSLGCAAENIVQSAGRFGYAAAADVLAGGAGVRVALTPAVCADAPLAAAVAMRQSTRAPFSGQPVPAEQVAALAAAARQPGVGLLMLSETRDMDRVLDAVAAGTRAQIADPAFVAELRHWLRFSYAQAVATGDGLFAACSGNPVMPEALGGVVFPLVFTAESEVARYAAQVRSSAGIAVFVADGADAAHWIAVGQAFQRFALTATMLGLKLSLLNQPVEVASVRGAFATSFGLGQRRADMVVRFGVGPSLPRSLRRPVEQVVDAA